MEQEKGVSILVIIQLLCALMALGSENVGCTHLDNDIQNETATRILQYTPRNRDNTQICRCSCRTMNCSLLLDLSIPLLCSTKYVGYGGTVP